MAMPMTCCSQMAAATLKFCCFAAGCAEWNGSRCLRQPLHQRLSEVRWRSGQHDNADLFAIIGTTWGEGDGSNTFNVQIYAVNLFVVGMNGKGTDSTVVLQARRVITISSTTTPQLQHQALAILTMRLRDFVGNQDRLINTNGQACRS